MCTVIEQLTFLLFLSLDSATTAPAWVPVVRRPQRGLAGLEASSVDDPQVLSKPRADLAVDISVSTLRACVLCICDSFEANAELLTSLDAVVGDGDLGANLKTAAEKVKLEIWSWPASSCSAWLSALAACLQQVRFTPNRRFYNCLTHL